MRMIVEPAVCSSEMAICVSYDAPGCRTRSSAV